MRSLVTGASGFAGSYLARLCATAGEEVFGASRSGAAPEEVMGVAVDLRDSDGTQRMLREVRPQVVYHLAALSSVGRSWEDPGGTVKDNVACSVSLLEALRHEAPDARVVWVSTCEVYGPAAQLPIAESAPLRPANPYAVSKTTGDMLAGVYQDAHGLDIVRVRPFNHAGPGQLPIFIMSSLAQQAAEARRAGAAELRIVTGNPETRRDFTDVRDVVRAYRSLAALGGSGAGPASESEDGAAPPDVYNVCSGRSVSAAEHVQLVAELIAPIQVKHAVDPARLRAHEVMDVRGDFGRLRRATDWEPAIPLRQTMQDTIEWWEHQLGVDSG